MIDFGQFGQALVYSPFNWTQSKIYGIEFTAQYRKDNLSAYFNAAVAWARAKGLSSGQYNFGQDELDYIVGHPFPCGCLFWQRHAQHAGGRYTEFRSPTGLSSVQRGCRERDPGGVA